MSSRQRSRVVVVGTQDQAERGGHGRRVEQFVLHHIDRLEKRLDRDQQAIPVIERLEVEPGRLTGQECGQLGAVQDVVGLIARDALLAQPKAESGSCRRTGRSVVEGDPAEPGLDPPGDAVLQLMHGPLSEGDGENRLSRRPLDQHVHHSPRHDLCLAGSRPRR